MSHADFPSAPLQTQSASTTRRLLDQILAKHSPTQAPLLWILLNAACCLAAAYVFLDAILEDINDDMEIREGEVGF